MEKNRNLWLRDGALTAAILVLAVVTGVVLYGVFPSETVIPLIFVLAVFLVSLVTRGYVWGIASAALSVLTVNFAFTAPRFAFNFEIVENAVSAAVMIIVTLATCTLTQTIKKHESVRRELDRETMRGNLLRAVSHDLRTPLTAIYGASSTIVDHYGALSEEDKLAMLRGIRDDSRWLIRMVENLLAVTRIDGGNVKLRKSSVVVEELVESAVGKFGKNHPEIPVELEIPDEFLTISADPILIEQVLVNFLENAADHAEGMGHLTLEVRKTEQQVDFRVLDDGCGMEPARLEGIFSGSAMKETDAGDRRGMGIGLSLCATIIRLHGGRIYAENRKTGGMCFGFTLDTEEDSHELESI